MDVRIHGEMVVEVVCRKISENEKMTAEVGGASR